MGLNSPGGSSYGAVTVSTYNMPDTGTMCFWIKNDGDGGHIRFMGNADGFEGRFYNNTDFYHEWCHSGAGALNTSVYTSSIYHIACLWKVSANDGWIYKNGSLATSKTSGYDDSAPTNYIAMFNRYGDNDQLDGALYDIRVYDRLLSADEIKTIYNSRGADSIVYGMLSRWVMDEKTNGSTLSGSGVVKDRGQKKINFSSSSGAPTYIYNTPIYPRRR